MKKGETLPFISEESTIPIQNDERTVYRDTIDENLYFLPDEEPTVKIRNIKMIKSYAIRLNFGNRTMLSEWGISHLQATS